MDQTDHTGVVGGGCDEERDYPEEGDGTAYLWTAGLMNLLLLFDIWDIGRRKKA